MITFDRVTKDFSAEKRGVKDLSFEVKEGETLVLLGQSGSGKTTALRLINRLIEPTSGTIFFEGEDVRNLDPIALRRQIGYAIQHIGLFLHMTVAENIAIVPRLVGWDKERIRNRVDQLLEMVGFDPNEMRDQMPGRLSGGQKQRIGVARALAADPPVILMDEPFGSLDPIIREELQNQFLNIQSKLKKTVVFVTHDMSEAVKMGDRIAVFEEGRVLQVATPKELLEQPANGHIDTLFGKDRFQLMLQTLSLNELVGDLEKGEKHPAIPLNSSLLEALVQFKISGEKSLSVFSGSTYLGNLNKDTLVEVMQRCT